MLIQDKEEYRKRAFDLINSYDIDILKKYDGKILKNVLKLKSFCEAKMVFIYVSVNREVDTRQIILKALEMGKTVAVPKCFGKGLMLAKKINSFAELLPGMMDIPEPSEYATTISPEMIDFAVVPCVACDISGTRLGYGGGYYDRYLPKLRKQVLDESVLLTRSFTCFEKLPKNDTDIKLKNIATENGVTKL